MVAKCLVAIQSESDAQQQQQDPDSLSVSSAAATVASPPVVDPTGLAGVSATEMQKADALRFRSFVASLAVQNLENKLKLNLGRGLSLSCLLTMSSCEFLFGFS